MQDYVRGSAGVSENMQVKAQAYIAELKAQFNLS